MSTYYITDHFKCTVSSLSVCLFVRLYPRQMFHLLRLPVAALHQGAPGQMLEDPPPWLPPWLRPGSRPGSALPSRVLLCFGNSVNRK